MTSRLLTFNCHEAWVHQLDALGVPFDVVDGLPGRYTRRWDERMRPRPKHGRLITRHEVEASYDAVIGHSLTDLLEVKDVRGPRLLVLHVTLDHRLSQVEGGPSREEVREGVARYLALVGGHVIAVTAHKRDTWGLEADVVESFAEPDDYPPWTGEVARGLRVANQIQRRRAYLAWDLHEAAFRDVPMDIVGHNPDMPGVEPAAGWDDLKRRLSRHRFFVHTADPVLEDGFNMALMEALAAGIPVVGNAHPTSPLVDGVSALLSDDPLVLASHGRRLLADLELARAIGLAGQEVGRARFGRPRFVAAMRAALAEARRRWNSRASA